MNGRALLLAILGSSLQAMPGQSARPPMVHGGAPAVSPDGSKIAFLSERDGATDLFIIAADGTGEARLTSTPEVESQPEWSADGSEIRFTVFANEESRIYSIAPTGKNRKLIGTVPGRAMRLSPDGESVLYWTGTWTAMRLFVSRLDGSAARPLTDGSGVVWGSRWSPDGKRIAFGDKEQGSLQIFVMNADGSGRRRVTRFDEAGQQAQMPAWSADGSRLAVQSGSRGQPAHIWIVDAVTGAARKLAAHTEPYDDEVPAWFPDGKSLAYQSSRTGRMEVWVMNADGSQARQLTK
jgi:Tol biopolymer transport system component